MNRLAQVSSRKALVTLKAEVLACLRSLVEERQWEFLISERALDDDKSYAEVDFEKRCIAFHPRKPGGVEEFVHTVVHEVLHILDSTARETTVQRIERQLAALWRPSELTELLRLATRRLRWEGAD